MFCRFSVKKDKYKLIKLILFACMQHTLQSCFWND